MWTAMLTVLLSALVVMFPDQTCVWALQKVADVPLGTTFEYYDDIQQNWFAIWCWVLTATIVCQKLGYDILAPLRCFAYIALQQLRPLLSSNVDYEAPSISKLWVHTRSHSHSTSACSNKTRVLAHFYSSYGKQGGHIQAMLKHRCESTTRCMCVVALSLCICSTTWKIEITFVFFRKQLSVNLKPGSEFSIMKTSFSECTEKIKTNI